LKPGFVPVAIVGKSAGQEVDTVAKIAQYYIPAPSFASSLSITIQLLMTKHAEGVLKAIVFLPAAHIANLFHAVGKEMKDIKVFVQHSRQSQSARTRVTNEFKECASGVMFATDVVARGMHFDRVSHVVQVGLPDGVETYTHRIGRTGRADASGEAWIVLAPRELGFIRDVERKGMAVVKRQVPGVEAGAQFAVGRATKKLVGDGEEGRVYQAWLGYYLGRIRVLNIDKKGIVEEANLFAEEVFGCAEPPRLEKKTVGKMGLKGVPGLRFK
jgi:ATP-dependent RNA helicase MSS116